MATRSKLRKEEAHILSATVLYLIATATCRPGLLYHCVNTTGPTECELLLFVNDVKPDVTCIGNSFVFNNYSWACRPCIIISDRISGNKVHRLSVAYPGIFFLGGGFNKFNKPCLCSAVLYPVRR